MRIPARWALAALVAVALPLGAATAATAGTHVPQPATYKATTRMIYRSDGGYAPGGSDTWAHDYFIRTLTLTAEGQGSCPSGQHQFTARLGDHGGNFITVAGAYTPNQSGPYAGHVINGIVYGLMNGYGEFGTFCASALPDMALVPPTEVGNIHSSSIWPELAFPSGTTFTGVSEDTYGYTYTARIVRVVRVPVFIHGHFAGWRWEQQVDHQQWNETSSNGDGDQPGDGNITG